MTPEDQNPITTTPSLSYTPPMVPAANAPMIPPGRTPAARAAAVARKTALTTWEGIWYVLMCVAFAGGYFAKIPAKKALQDFGLVEMTSAEGFWYVLMCLAFGGGYFAKIPTAKALSELPQYRAERKTGLGRLG